MSSTKDLARQPTPVPQLKCSPLMCVTCLMDVVSTVCHHCDLFLFDLCFSLSFSSLFIFFSLVCLFTLVLFYSTLFYLDLRLSACLPVHLYLFTSFWPVCLSVGSLSIFLLSLSLFSIFTLILLFSLSLILVFFSFP